MLNVDHFESFFRSAAKATYHHQRVALSPALIIGDDPSVTPGLSQILGRSLRPGEGDDGLKISALEAGTVRDIPTLIDALKEAAPKLIVTWRNLFSETWRYPYSLGEHLDVLTQVTDIPVLLLPHPKGEHALGPTAGFGQRVMAITDHLTGDESLIQHAVALTKPGGTLYLSHVEDDATFQRYIDTVSRIPNLNTDIAREEIAVQLLKEPRDYIQSCKGVLKDQGVKISVEAVIEMGHFLKEYTRLIEAHEVDLLVLNTKDDDQRAMHGLAYPLAVEMRHIPMLLL